MGNTGALLLHGLFEHKGRHQINADWFNNLNIETTLIDLPGHGKEEVNKGDIESWNTDLSKFDMNAFLISDIT